MQVARWGNSLAVRLPAAVVEVLDLRGDEFVIDVARDRSRERAHERVCALRRPLRPGWRFDRDQAEGR